MTKPKGWIRLECRNVDSCEDGAKHFYPNLRTKVVLPKDVETRVVGSSRFIVVPAGTYSVVSIMAEAHQVAILVGVTAVWVDIDDDIQQP